MDIPGRDRVGRGWYTAQAKADYIERFRQSGLSQRGFCEREGLKLPTFSSWINKAKPKPSTGFREVSIGPVGSFGSGLGIEVILPDGIIIRGQDAGELTGMIKLLRDQV